MHFIGAFYLSSYICDRDQFNKFALIRVLFKLFSTFLIRYNSYFLFIYFFLLWFAIFFFVSIFEIIFQKSWNYVRYLCEISKGFNNFCLEVTKNQLFENALSAMHFQVAG